jgi:hypothetical protein
MGWDEIKFQERALARAKRLGLADTINELEKRSPVGKGFFAHPPSEEGGRHTGKLEKLAGYLDWSLCQMLGCEGEPSRPLLKLAIDTAWDALRGEPYRNELLPTAAFEAYLAFAAQQGDDKPVDDSFRSAVRLMIRNRDRQP